MDHYLSRNRNKMFPTALIAGQLLLLAYQVRRPNARGVQMVRTWSVEAILPAERLSQSLVGGGRGMVRGYVALREVRLRNQQLQSQISTLELQNEQLRESVRELPQLEALLGFQRAYGLRTVAAAVISSGASADAQAVYVDRGASAGLGRNMAVMTPNGVVGKISELLSSSAQVLLVTDPDSGVGAVIEPAGVHGILRGLGAGRVEVRNVLKDEPTPVGAAVVTSGEDQVYPKGIPIGTVTGSTPDSDGVFKTVRVKLAADLDRLEQVLVITGALPPPGNQPAAGETAADIRQAQLPSLPAFPTSASAPAAAVPPPAADIPPAEGDALGAPTPSPPP